MRLTFVATTFASALFMVSAAVAAPKAAPSSGDNAAPCSPARYARCQAFYGANSMREGWLRNRCTTRPFGPAFDGTDVQKAFDCLRP